VFKAVFNAIDHYTWNRLMRWIRAQVRGQNRAEQEATSTSLLRPRMEINQATAHPQRPDQSISPGCLNMQVNDPNPIFERHNTLQHLGRRPNPIFKRHMLAIVCIYQPIPTARTSSVSPLAPAWPPWVRRPRMMLDGFVEMPIDRAIYQASPQGA
jgi:hypothetical protein